MFAVLTRRTGSLSNVRRARIDAALLGLVGLVAWLIGAEFDMVERMIEFAEAHEDWELDEAIWAGLVVGAGLLVYAVRRAGDLRRAVEAHDAANERAQFLARHDPLTGLANRRQFDERLAQELARSRRQHTNLAVMLIDIDHFKEVNDGFGHDAGDACLVEVAKRLQQAIRETDLAARLGGDEFAVIQTDVDQPSGATALAKRLQAALAVTYELPHGTTIASGSIGVAIIDGDEAIASDLALKQADIALYRAKDEGRGTFRFYATDMDAALLARRGLEAELRQAFADEAFELHYQPQYRVANGEPIGCEALLRWRHPTRGLVPPDEFISLAEDTGLIVPITHWVVENACQEAATWPNGLSIAVNISATHLRGTDLVDCVEGSLQRSGLAPERLELELTEHVLVDRADQALATLQQLHLLGVRLALDDFGTGYSSLSHLWRFPFDRIKIDKSFVLSMGDDPKARRIIGTVLQLGESLDCEVLAEGVETEQQLAWLAANHCGAVQGYYFSRPVPAESLSIVGFATADQPAPPVLEHV
ncbi:MAG: EAL domain-containing protein [Pseudomonadota bacterium]